MDSWFSEFGWKTKFQVEQAGKNFTDPTENG